MKRIKKLFTFGHIFLWVLLGLLVAFQLHGDDTSAWITSTAAFMVTGLYTFYGHFFILTRYWYKNKKAYFFRLCGIIISAPVIFSLTHYNSPVTQNDLIDLYGMALVTIVPVFMFLGWLARVSENLVLNTIRKEQLEKEAIIAELYYLKSQINPHFLFNTLNNIHTLVYKQAPAAPEAVMRLASLMRYMIYESNAPLVPLTRELDYLQDYISLQQLRYKKAPVADFEIRGNAASCEIAPLLFIHLLENAFKHSPARLEEGDIKVMIEIIAKKITLTITNPIDKNSVNNFEKNSGIGLQNVRKRLALLYPGTHTLEIDPDVGNFKIKLEIGGIQVRTDERKTDLLHH